MKEHAIMGQIAKRIIKGSFEGHIHKKASVKKHAGGMSELIQRSMDQNLPPPLVSAEALDKAIFDSIDKYASDEFLLPDLMIRAEYTAKSRKILADHAGDAVSLSKGKAILATLEGKDLAHWQDMMDNILKGLGYRTLKGGTHKSATQIVESVTREKPDILAVTTPSGPIPEFNVKPSMTLKSGIQRILKLISKADYPKSTTILIGGINGYGIAIHSEQKSKAQYQFKNLRQTIVHLKELALSTN